MPEMTKNDNYQPMSFDAIKIGLASPETILEWSHGAVSYTHLHDVRNRSFIDSIIHEKGDCMSETNWYVVHTYSGYENKVKANICLLYTSFRSGKRL